MTDDKILPEDMDREQLLEEIKRLNGELKTANIAWTEMAKQLREQAQAGMELAETIISTSQSVLFRRAAGDLPRLMYVSDNISQWGFNAEDFLANKLKYKDIVYSGDHDRLVDEITAYAEADVEEYSMEYRIVTADGETRWVSDHTSVVRDEDGNRLYNQGVVTDITERKEIELQLAHSEHKFRRIIETTPQGFVLFDKDMYILDVNEAYCKLLGMDKDELIGLRTGEIATDDFRRFLQVHGEQLLAQTDRIFEGSLLHSSGREIPVLIYGNTLRCDDGHIIGNVAFVADLTDQKRALQLAGDVQKSLLTIEPPSISGLDVAGRSDPCDEVGGDYLDYPPVMPEMGATRLMAAVGDISGHGVDAALLMTAARAFIRAHSAQGLSPVQIITELNRQLVADFSETGRFMTLLIMCVDQEAGELIWSRAGHDPALLYDITSDTFTELGGEGIPVGVLEDFEFRENRAPILRPGQIIALGSDGIWESRTLDGKMFGKERFQSIIQENAHLESRKIIQAVFDAVKDFTEDTRSLDDMTLLLIKRDS